MATHFTPAAQEDSFWNIPFKQHINNVNTSSDKGLSSQEANQRLAKFGPNTSTVVNRAPLWWQFLLRFRNPLVILLLVASAISAIMGDVPSFLIIIVIVVLSVLFDFFQEVRAEKTVDALRRSVELQARVIRDANIYSIPVEQLVPGDIVELSSGTLIPADGCLIVCNDIYVNQALLTGESFPVEKNTTDLIKPTQDITEATNSLFKGTSIISGNGKMVVINTGKNTRLGALSEALSQRHPTTTFELGIAQFGMLIMHIAILMVLFVVFVNIVFHRPMMESFLFALALAVGLTPELLPMIMTITLSHGAIRMAKNRVIVKHLPAMYNLGAMDVLCTDKTGTLTEAKIKLIKVLNTEFQESNSVFTLAYLNSYFESGIKSGLDQAILDFSNPDISIWQKIDEVPFDFERRRVSVLCGSPDKHFLIVKGAPEDILKLCTHYETGSCNVQHFDANKRAECHAKFEALGEEGFRVLAIAYREVRATLETARITDETALVFAGFAVFIDPPKMDAANTLINLASDGIHVKIISGDNERVTRHVCDMLGFNAGEIILGDQLGSLSDEALQAKIETTHVFCRINPQQKSRIITALKRNKHNVGFMGDGINDAIALHVADVGISVDTGADAAKEAADMILLEHDLSVIHQSIIEGRRAVANTEKYILMGSSSNFGNMFSMAGAALFIPFLPMLPIQILLNNLLYDVSQSAIPFDNVDKTAISQPLHWNMRRIKIFMGVMGPASSIFDFITFYVLLRLFHADEILFHTGWFVESIVTQALIIFSIRTRLSLFKSKPNPIVLIVTVFIASLGIILPFMGVNKFLGFIPLPGSFFIFLILAVVLYFILVELIKVGFRKL
jgi:Mg2+-importing ATPase